MLSRILPLVALLLLPGLAAADEETATFPKDVPLDGKPLALIAQELPGFGRIQQVELRAETLEVYEGKRNGVESKLLDSTFVITEYDDRSYVIHNATLRLERMVEAGFIGLHVHDEDATLRFDASGVNYSVHSRPSGEMYTMQNTGDATRDESKNDSMHYYHRLPEPHLYVLAPGRVEYHGAAMVQLYGVEVMLAAEENATRIRTGFTSSGSPVGSATLRFLNVRATNLTLVAVSSTPWEIALSEGQVDGLTVEPTADGFGITLAEPAPQAAAPPAPRTGGFPWAVLLATCAATATVSGGSALILRQRSRRAPVSAVHDPVECWDPEECLQRMKVHQDAENWARALEWTDRARDLAPTSGRVHSTRAFLLEQLGRLDEALAAYADAALFDPIEGEHDVHAARIAAALGRPREEVLHLVTRGLARTPGLVTFLEEAPWFRHLVGEPLYDKAVEEAWALHARELSQPEEGDDACS